MQAEPAPRRRALLLMGPTGSGKSDVAMRLAETLPVEIVSVDSALVYRGMDIGTAKPSAAMSEWCTISSTFAIRRRLFGRRIHARRARGDAGDLAAGPPPSAGGTTLYFHALTMGLAVLPEADSRVRAKIDAQAASGGWAAVHRHSSGWIRRRRRAFISTIRNGFSAR